ncbi:MAG: hypothetical protein ABR508_04410 [Candidatus Baltobacteraceae bacterium]
MRWSIDAADAYSVAKVRHAVIEQLKSLTNKGADLYAVETVLGELLGAEMERGHLALAIIIERAVGGPAVHIYTQGTPAVNSTQGELRNAILEGTSLPMSMEATSQGTHISFRIPVARAEPLRAPR